MRNIIIFLSSTLLLPTIIHSQTTELEGTAKLGPTTHVFKIVTIPGCPQSYTPPVGTAGTTVIHQTKYTNDKTEITVEDTVHPGTPILIPANKTIRVPLSPNSDGFANFYTDDKDKSVLYVNYWLNSSNTVAAGTTVEEFKPVYNCAGAVVMTSQGTRVLALNETFTYVRVNSSSPDMATTWFANSDQIRVLNAAGGVDYYLVNRYDRTAKYVLDLPNRQYIAYNSQSLDLGALTIPFKYRFGFKKNGIDIKDDVTASFNIGLYGGYKISRYKIINKGGTFTNKSTFSLRIGPFINVSSTTLDSISTTVGKIPMKKDEKQNIAVLSTGLGLMANFKNVQVGVYGGWDFGVGPEAGNWNYHKKFWLGFGLGYKLTDLFAQKE